MWQLGVRRVCTDVEHMGKMVVQRMTIISQGHTVVVIMKSEQRTTKEGKEDVTCGGGEESEGRNGNSDENIRAEMGLQRQKRGNMTDIKKIGQRYLEVML